MDVLFRRLHRHAIIHSPGTPDARSGRPGVVYVISGVLPSFCYTPRHETSNS